MSHILIGIIFGGLCWKIGDDASKIDQNISFIFLCMLFLLFSSLMPTLMSFPSDMKGIFKTGRKPRGKLKEHTGLGADTGWLGLCACIITA